MANENNNNVKETKVSKLTRIKDGAGRTFKNPKVRKGLRIIFVIGGAVALGVGARKLLPILSGLHAAAGSDAVKEIAEVAVDGITE